MWGIGRFLYSLKIIKIKEVIKDGKDRNGKDKYAPALNGQKIWDINTHCNNLHSGKAQPTVAKKKTIERKPALTNEQFLQSKNGSKEQIQTVLDKFRMADDQRKTLERLVK